MSTHVLAAGVAVEESDGTVYLAHLTTGQILVAPGAAGAIVLDALGGPTMPGPGAAPAADREHILDRLVELGYLRSVS